LLDALPAAVERLPNVRLVVAGEFYDDEAPYRAQVERHGLAQHVRFVPDYIPEAEVGAYFSAADLVVQPYVTATQSGVAQIAFHFERPLVVTDVGGLAEIVPHGEAGLVVPPEDPEALASAIVRFFEDDLGEALTAGVRRERPKYEWARVYEAVEALARG
jgi:glycosyltransferase involved in cell wall biosynthesis